MFTLDFIIRKQLRKLAQNLPLCKLAIAREPFTMDIPTQNISNPPTHKPKNKQLLCHFFFGPTPKISNPLVRLFERLKKELLVTLSSHFCSYQPHTSPKPTTMQKLEKSAVPSPPGRWTPVGARPGAGFDDRLGGGGFGPPSKS